MFKKLIKDHPLFLSFLVLYMGFLLYKVIRFPTPFFDWDESLYIQTGREMLQHKYFLFPIWQGVVWLDKPPLIPLVYGIVAKLVFFTTPEVSTRVFTVLISGIVLSLLYRLYLKASEDKKISTLAVMITAFTPIFLQRSQVVNLDMFLLLGWVGYAVFFENFWISLLFLLLGVMSKSLIGFYPIGVFGMYYGYLFITHKMKNEELVTAAKKLTTQFSIGLLWFVSMFLIFGEKFWKQHIIESHFRRVTSSIEFHFGQKTFYIDLARQELGVLFWFAIVGLVIVIVKYFKKEERLLAALYLLPWFLFLNLTKTKIFWYFYSAIPQFGFLAAANALLFKKTKPVYYVVLLIIAGVLMYQSFITKNVLAQQYSKPEPYYYLALFAKDKCSKMSILMDEQTRDSFAQLDKQGLLITTTKWWGSHPSMVYYFGKKIDFVYDKAELIEKSVSLKSGECVVLSSSDENLLSESRSFQNLKNFDTMQLYIKNQ
jgi:4-amino-4-deoxy-L-arabinose transferase-like glycosyltransferase